jgi:hypothetical protein
MENSENILYCQYCGEPAELIDSKEIYKRPGYGLIYLCRKCNAYVGVHEGTTIPKGTLANETLRKLRKDAHKYFDPLWKDKIIKEIVTITNENTTLRKIAYLWLAEQLKIESKYCHIGNFDEKQCINTIKICKNVFDIFNQQRKTSNEN